MLDEQVCWTLRRLEQEDSGGGRFGRSGGGSYAVAPTTGKFLFALVAPQPGCEVLEIGASRGYSTIWLTAAARMLGGHVASLERDRARAASWRANIAERGSVSGPSSSKAMQARRCLG